jgi:hypothetical protein
MFLLIIPGIVLILAGGAQEFAWCPLATVRKETTILERRILNCVRARARLDPTLARTNLFLRPRKNNEGYNGRHIHGYYCELGVAVLLLRVLFNRTTARTIMTAVIEADKTPPRAYQKTTMATRPRMPRACFLEIGTWTKRRADDKNTSRRYRAPKKGDTPQPTGIRACSCGPFLKGQAFMHIPLL